MTPTHPFGIFPPDSRGTYKMCTCYGTAIPYPIGPVYHTAIENNMEADVCMPGVESSRLLFFLTARNAISITIAVHYWLHNLSCHGFSSSQRSLTRIIVCRKVKTTILITLQYYQTGALEVTRLSRLPRRGCVCQTSLG